jgi:hypothetical protein
MPLSLPETQAIAELADHLYNYLPGKAHPYARPPISFETISAQLGLGNSWPGGSKLPAITMLLERTLEYRRGRFCDFILAVVREGIKYRTKKGQPLTRDEIEMLNQLVLKVGFKIPELWDPSFLASLPSKPKTDSGENEPGLQPSPSAERLAELRQTFLNLEKMEPQKRGFAFERFLNELFAEFGLTPRGSFRLRGEQIDGSFEFESNTYLVEAKWQLAPIGQAELLVLHGKVAGKATWSRGLFVSVGGFSHDGLDAFSRGRPSNLIAMNGQDLYFILEGEMRLPEALRLKTRRAAETGRVMVSVYQLLAEGYGGKW